MRVLVTGAAGLLGTEVLRVFDSPHDVTGVDLDDFDIADLDATSAALRSHRPDAVVHCAAWSDVDGAESAFEQAFLANAIGAKNVALAANEVGARLFHVSTDYVFDGTAGRPEVRLAARPPLLRGCLRLCSQAEPGGLYRFEQGR